METKIKEKLKRNIREIQGIFGDLRDIRIMQIGINTEKIVCRLDDKIYLEEDEDDVQTKVFINAHEKLKKIEEKLGIILVHHIDYTFDYENGDEVHYWIEFSVLL